MAEFVWEARARTGEIRKGTMTADDAAAVEERLRNQQLAVVTVKKKLAMPKFQFGSGVDTKELVTFTRQFATMIDAGLPLVQCLDILSTQTPNKIFANVLKDVKGSVEGGSTFSDALKRHPKVFDELFTNLVQAGEVGGILDAIMNRLAVYIEKRVKLIRQLRGAMTYPSVVCVIAGGVMSVLMIFVIPAFEGMFKDFGSKAALPKITQVVVAISHAFVNQLGWIVLGLLAVSFTVVYTYKIPKGKRFYHKLMLTIPVIGNVLQKIAVARFTRTLGTLLQSGVPILDALEICAKSSGNIIIEEAVMYVRARASPRERTWPSLCSRSPSFRRWWCR